LEYDQAVTDVRRFRPTWRPTWSRPLHARVLLVVGQEVIDGDVLGLYWASAPISRIVWLWT
jgi:hypothetical protein